MPTRSFLLLSASSVLLCTGCNNNDLPTPKAGMPLLEQASSPYQTFQDRETGFQFTPPGNWSQQVRSTGEAGEAKGERPIVKYKRLIDGLRPAWLKVSILQDATTPLEELLAKKVPGPGWRQVGGIEGQSLRGFPAARIMFQGKYDQYGDADFSREIVAVRRGSDVFFFSGTYMSKDETARRRIRAAIESMDWNTGAGA